MACDICGKNTTSLEDLVPAYQTREVRQICPECLRLANKALMQMRFVATKMTTNMFNRWLLVMHQKFHPGPTVNLATRFHPDHDDKNDHCNCPSCR